MNEGTRYVIWIRGHLAPHRLGHFDHVTVRQASEGRTTISGSFRDQAALYGLLNWLQRLGMTLLLVKQSEGAVDTDQQKGSETVCR
jgi:hypothetical protein